jgi:hypothetical protein
MSAVLGAPGYLSGVSPVEKEMFTRKFNEARAPEVAKRLEVMTKAQELLQQRAGLVFTEIEKAIGAPRSRIDAIRKGDKAMKAAFK